MSVPNVLIRETVNRLIAGFKKRGRVVIESPPNIENIAEFLISLNQIDGPPLATRFTFSHRDGAVAVSHRLPNKPDEALALFPDRERVSMVTINLFTQTQDYTWRCRDRFDAQFGWREFALRDNGTPAPGHNAEILVSVVTPLFDDLQRHLLTNWPCYLHYIRVDAIDRHGVHELIFTVETARRYRTERERNIGNADLVSWGWPHMEDYSRRPAPREEITLWAALSIQDTDPKLDDERLQVIATAIRAENLSREAVATEPDVILVDGGNRVALLRARSAQHQDGRARFALARAAMMDQGVIPRAPRGLEMEHFRLNPSPDSPKLQYDMDNWPTVLKIIFSDLLVSSLGLFYLFRLQSPDADVDAVVGVALAIVGALALPSLPLWFKIYTGKYDATHVLRRRRAATVKELLRQARGDTRARIEAVTSPAALLHFDGNGLSFSGLHYEGNHSFVDDTFTVKHLLEAGYQTTFARDGREVLISPASSSSSPPIYTRLRINPEHKVLFERVANNTRDNHGRPTSADLDLEVLRFVRGIWPSNVYVGRQQQPFDDIEQQSSAYSESS